MRLNRSISKGSGLISQFSLKSIQSPVIIQRSYSEIKEPKVAVITGASRGIGYATAMELAKRMSSGHIYLTTRGDPDHLTRTIGDQLGPEKMDMVEFHTMEVNNQESIYNLVHKVNSDYGRVDILINNAGQYFEPSSDPSEHQRNVKCTLSINYWGLKTICQVFAPLLDPVARVVNLSSHLGHVSLLPGSQVRSRFSRSDLTEEQLDHLVNEYQDLSISQSNEFSQWPKCAYTMSKIAVNAYTRLLQMDLEANGQEGVVVNCLHPGSYHSKISQESPLDAKDAAKSVVCLALLSHPCSHPRGKFLWHDLQIIDWEKGNLEGMWA